MLLLIKFFCRVIKKKRKKKNSQSNYQCQLSNWVLWIYITSIRITVVRNRVLKKKEHNQLKNENFEDKVIYTRIEIQCNNFRYEKRTTAKLSKLVKISRLYKIFKRWRIIKFIRINHECFNRIESRLIITSQDETLDLRFNIRHNYT